MLEIGILSVLPFTQPVHHQVVTHGKNDAPVNSPIKPEKINPPMAPRKMTSIGTVDPFPISSGFQYIIGQPDDQQRDRPQDSRQQRFYREKVNDDGYDDNGRRQLKNGNNQDRKGAKSWKRYTRQHEHRAGGNKLKECNPRMPLATFLTVAPVTGSISSLRSPARRRTSFRTKIGRSISFDKEYAGDDHRDEEHDEALPKPPSGPITDMPNFDRGSL